MRFLFLLATTLFIFQATAEMTTAQSPPQVQTKWQCYEVDRTNLSLELPAKPSQITLSDLPASLHRRVTVKSAIRSQAAILL